MDRAFGGSPAGDAEVAFEASIGTPDLLGEVLADGAVLDLTADEVVVELPAAVAEVLLEPIPLPAPPERGLRAATRAQFAAKRAIDVVGSLAALILLAPLMLLTALLIAITSRGPVLYVQERVGHHGRRFRMWKFRSMYRDAHEDRVSLLHRNEADGPHFKIRDDPRITPVGRVIRKLSIDELPQLVNVLRGEMSLVGPRPPLPEEVAEYGARERLRLAVKPGITCIWQVRGRADLDFDTWVDMDLQYVREWTLLLDLKLLALTVPAVLSGRGAY